MSNPPPAITVRPARRDDAQAIVAFAQALADETEDKQLDPAVLSAGVNHLFDRPEFGFYLVAEIDGRVVGSLMITFEWSDWRNGVFWWVQSVYVLPAFRRRGIYRRLYQHVHRQAREQSDVCGLRLYVEKNNHAAQQTYHALGMTDSPYFMFEQILEHAD